MQPTGNISNDNSEKDLFVLSNSVQSLENDPLFESTTLVIDVNKKSKDPNLNTPLQPSPNTNDKNSQINTHYQDKNFSPLITSSLEQDTQGYKP